MAVRHQVNRQSHDVTRARHGQPRALRRGSPPDDQALVRATGYPCHIGGLRRCSGDVGKSGGIQIPGTKTPWEPGHTRDMRTTEKAVYITPFSHGEAVLYSAAPSPDTTRSPAVRSVRRPRQCRRHHRSRIRLGHRRTQIRSDRKQRHHRHQPQRRREKRSSAGSLLDSVLSQEAWTRCLRRRRHQRMVNRRRR